MPYLRDILNHYILNSVVTFEMVELSLKTENLVYPVFGYGTLSVICCRGGRRSHWLCSKSTLSSKTSLCPSVMSSIYLHPEHTGKGIGEKIYSELIENLKKPRMFTEYMVLWFYQTPVPRDFTKNWAFRSPGYSMRVATNLASITMSVCTNIVSKNNSILKDTADSQSK